MTGKSRAEFEAIVSHWQAHASDRGGIGPAEVETRRVNGSSGPFVSAVLRCRCHVSDAVWVGAKMTKEAAKHVGHLSAYPSGDSHMEFRVMVTRDLDEADDVEVRS